LKNGVLYYIYYQVGGKFLDELHLMKKWSQNSEVFRSLAETWHPSSIPWEKNLELMRPNFRCGNNERSGRRIERSRVEIQTWKIEKLRRQYQINKAEYYYSLHLATIHCIKGSSIWGNRLLERLEEHSPPRLLVRVKEIEREKEKTRVSCALPCGVNSVGNFQAMNRWSGLMAQCIN
jgi:hypothetical protein